MVTGRLIGVGVGPGAPDLLTLRADDDCRLQVHLRLLVFERATVWDRSTLRLDFDQVKACRTIVVIDDDA